MKTYPEIKTKYLIKLYKKGYSLPEISEKVGMTIQAVNERLQRVGFKLRSHKEAAKLAIRKNRQVIHTGKNHHSWKGGKYKDKRGYICVNNGRDFQHRVVWEKAHGKIPKGYIIHHLNGIRDDNRLENLISIPRKRHSPATIIEPHQKRIRELEKQLNKLLWR